MTRPTHHHYDVLGSGTGLIYPAIVRPDGWVPGDPLATPEPIAGFHVNTTADWLEMTPALEPYVITPTEQSLEWAGGVTVALRFDSLEDFLTVAGDDAIPPVQVDAFTDGPPMKIFAEVNSETGLVAKTVLFEDQPIFDPPEGHTYVEATDEVGPGFTYMDGEFLAPPPLPTQPAPEPARRSLPKSTVQERVNAIGKLGHVLAVLNSQPIFFARWFAPDWPEVFADDEGLLAILVAVGCTPEEIAVIIG